jgi:hypothetical protein
MNAQIYLYQQYKRSITDLFKDMLKIVEDMKNDHTYHYDKLYENIPAEYHPVIKTADHFTAEKSAWIRKKILDMGNESLRDFSSEMENVSVSFIFKQ